jgi:aspartyl protease family protein
MPRRAGAASTTGTTGRKRFIGGNTTLIALGWLFLLGAMFWFFFDWNEREAHPNRNLKATASSEIVLKRSRDGHYYAEGEINGRRVNFMLDTGATQIALSRGLADELGLKLGSSLVLQTAAGPAAGHAARLASVRVGDIEMSDLGAVVSEGMREPTVLLGMNFLRRLEMIQRGDQLTLRPLAAPGG